MMTRKQAPWSLPDDSDDVPQLLPHSGAEHSRSQQPPGAGHRRHQENQGWRGDHDQLRRAAGHHCEQAALAADEQAVCVSVWEMCGPQGERQPGQWSQVFLLSEERSSESGDTAALTWPWSMDLLSLSYQGQHGPDTEPHLRHPDQHGEPAGDQRGGGAAGEDVGEVQPGAAAR